MALSTKKDIEKRMLIKRTVAAMEKQIQKLEEQKNVNQGLMRLSKETGIKV